MKKSNLFLLLIEIILGITSIHAQGVLVYVSDSVVHTFPYEMVDSIVAHEYKEHPSISFSPCTIKQLTPFSVKVSGTLRGVDNPVETGVIYSRSPEVSIVKGRCVAVVSRDSFTVSVKGLFGECTYYLRPYAKVGNSYYYGEVQRLEMEEPVTYTIDNRGFQMVRVVSDTLPEYYIMQTEIHPYKDITFTNVKMHALDEIPHVNAFIKVMYAEWIQRLREETGLPFRLPTEDEWIYAAKGGKYSKGYLYSGSDNIEEVAWYADNYKSNNYTHGIALKKPNELGLYDMSGNYGEVTYQENDGVDGNIYGGYWNSTAGGCKITSYEIGKTSGKIENSKYGHEFAFDPQKETIRLVYSVKDDY